MKREEGLGKTGSGTGDGKDVERRGTREGGMAYLVEASLDLG